MNMLSYCSNKGFLKYRVFCLSPVLDLDRQKAGNSFYICYCAWVWDPFIGTEKKGGILKFCLCCCPLGPELSRHWVQTLAWMQEAQLGRLSLFFQHITKAPRKAANIAWPAFSWRVCISFKQCWKFSLDRAWSLNVEELFFVVTERTCKLGKPCNDT